MEGALLGLFMIAACGFATLLEHPASPAHQARLFGHSRSHRLTRVSPSAQAKCGSSSAGEIPSTPNCTFQRSSTSGGVRCQKPLLISVLPPTHRPSA